MKRKHQHIFNIFTGLFVAVFSMAMSGCGTQHRHEKNLDQTTAQSISEKQLSMYSSASLPSVTDSLYETPSGKDRACLIYKLLAIRHKEFPADATISVHANMKLHDRYIFDFHDVSQAMEYLNAAADICETKKINTAEVE